LEEFFELKPLRVLVVEDHEVHRVLLQDMIGVLGGRVHLACDGEEAVQIGGRIPFDLILMDLALPRMDGEAATLMLRALGVECPIIAVTAHVPWRRRSDFARYGFDGLIEKPISVGMIASTLQAARTFAADRGSRLSAGTLRAAG
jgi:CheY-like chemotaxis protein